jgi:hypothetical protein
MSSADKPNSTVIAADMTEASLAAVLLYGLTLDDEDPALGVLLGARRELGLIVNLAEGTHPGMDFELTDFVPVLESIGRRLDVAIELMTRAQRVGSINDSQGYASNFDPDGVTLNGTVER